MSDNQDLNNLVPFPRQNVNVGGKVYSIRPMTMRDRVRLARLEETSVFAEKKTELETGVLMTAVHLLLLSDYDFDDINAKLVLANLQDEILSMPPEQAEAVAEQVNRVLGLSSPDTATETALKKKPRRVSKTAVAILIMALIGVMYTAKFAADLIYPLMLSLI